MKSSILLMTTIAILVTAPALRADDAADLEAAVEKAIQAWESGDVAAILDSYHGDAVGFYATSAFPADVKATGKDQVRKNLENFFANNDIVSITPRNHYRIIGDVGVAWGHGTLVVKPKDGPARTRHNRRTGTYIKSGGKWRLASWHASAIPSHN